MPSIALQRRLLEALQQPDYVPLAITALAAQLQLAPAEQKRLQTLIKELTQEGLIVKVKRDRFCLPSDVDLVSGKILFRQSGSARLLRSVRGQNSAETFEIRAEDTGVALHSDHVLCRVLPRRPLYPYQRRQQWKSKTSFVRVIRVLQRANETIIGTLQCDKNCYYLIPSDPRFVHDILTSDPKRCGLNPIVNQKVVVRLYEWKQRHLNPQGEIIEVLGQTHAPDAEWRALLHKYKLSPDFPQNVQREVRALPKKVRSEDRSGRLDLRDAFTLTIDPDDAKDFDDALSLELQPGGDVRIGIHIADVRAYVSPGSAIDKEAQKRGNSTYLVEGVIPMLPFELSNGLCSLVEGEDRLTQSVLLTFDASGVLKKTIFATTVIRSRKRLTYRQAYALLVEDDLKAIRATPLPPKHQTGAIGRPLKTWKDAELRELQKTVRQLWHYAARLREAHFKNGALDLDMPEIKIFVDLKGVADRIEKTVNDESHQLIEAFMLQANECVARHLLNASVLSLYRVHDKPEAEKLAELGDALKTAGIKAGDLTVRKKMVALLQQIEDHPQAYTLKLAVLRSLKPACYRATTDGHYGLNKRYYTHFTSPIRRYADLIVHRILVNHLTSHHKKSVAKRSQTYKTSELMRLSEHLTLTERNSVEAERESVKLKLLEFFDRELHKRKKTVFPAMITDLRNYGIGVELTDSMAYGLVHISTLKDDLYRLSPDGTRVIGRRRQRAFTIGQHVDVVVERVDRYKREIDFRFETAPS